SVPPLHSRARASFHSKTSQCAGKFRRADISGNETARMNPKDHSHLRVDALQRAESHSPFLRQALDAQPAIADAFRSRGAAAAADLAPAATAATLETELRGRRHG